MGANLTDTRRTAFGKLVGREGMDGMNDGSAVTYSLGCAECLFKSRNDLGCQVVKGTQGLRHDGET
jgi:hypothetical protein